jgi:hypothetical protein
VSARLLSACSLALVAALASTAHAQPAASGPASRRAEPDGAEAARDLLRQAIDLYVIGRYREAAERLRPLVETRVLQDRADQREALRAYGISLFLSGARAGAARAFRDLLRLEPLGRLDPAFVRADVVRFFEAVRAQHIAEQNELLRKRGPRGSAAANLLPPWGQFQNGHRRKAYTILGGEIAFTIASVASGVLLWSWAGETREFRGHESAYKPLVAINYASFSALAALVAYGVVDGLYYYYRAPATPRRTGPKDHTSREGHSLVGFVF